MKRGGEPKKEVEDEDEWKGKAVKKSRRRREEEEDGRRKRRR